MSAYLLPCGCVAAAVHTDDDHVCRAPNAPIEVDLTLGAAWVVTLADDRNLAEPARQALTLWAMMVGLDDDHHAALALARRIHDTPDADGTLVAYTPPM